MSNSVCPICSGGMMRLFDMPKFPFTGRYGKPDPDAYADQQFLYCEPCSHGKLLNVINAPRDGFKQGESATHALYTFASFIKGNLWLPDYDLLIDIGGGNGALADALPRLTPVIVDPNGRHERAVVVPNTLAEANLSSYAKDRKLIACSHTLEHVDDVNAFLSAISGIWAYGNALAISVPDMRQMVRYQRMDLIHHEHIHYFSERSLGLILAKHGFGIKAIDADPMHWWSMMVIAEKKTHDVSAEYINRWTIANAMTDFTAFMREIRIPKGAIALGAAQMLPVLAYYMRSLENVEVIADADKEKDGKRFVNVDKPIKREVDIKGRDVVVTAIASRTVCRELTALAMKAQARDVIVPVRVL